eukprot:6689446-Alexandrium_andersonii.AAC.1
MLYAAPRVRPNSGSATWTTALGQQRIIQCSALFSRFERFPAPPPSGGATAHPGPPEKRLRRAGG